MQRRQLSEETIAGISFIAIGLILIAMNAQVRFTWYSFTFYGRQYTSGLLFIPLFIGIIMLVAMQNKLPGKIVTGISILSILIALVLSLHIHLNSMSVFNFILLFLPLLLGIGLIIKSYFK